MMTVEKTLTWFALIDFAALNAAALYFEGASGLVSFLEQLGWWGAVLVADLLIALTLVLVWMWRDARARHGDRPLGYTLLTLGTGSIGPLLYLVRRPTQEEVA